MTVAIGHPDHYSPTIPHDNQPPLIRAAIPADAAQTLYLKNPLVYASLRAKWSDAVASGEAVLSGLLPALGDLEGKLTNQTVLVMPIYRSPKAETEEERQRAYWGALGVRLNLDRLLDFLNEYEHTTKFAMRLSYIDGEGRENSFSSEQFGDLRASRYNDHSYHFQVAGNLWQLQLVPTREALSTGSINSATIIAGIITSVLVGVFVWLFLHQLYQRVLIDREQKRTEELVSNNQALNQQVKDLTLSVQNAEDFIGILSHEVRNPLSAILSVQTMLENSMVTPTEKKLAEYQRLALNTALDTLNNTLDLKKLELSALELDEVEFEPLLLIKELDSLIGIQCKAKDQSLSVILHTEMPRVVMGDPLRLKQVLINLLNNAVKFTPNQGRVTLSVHAERMQTGLWRLRFTVQDTGVGMTEAELQQLFKPYSQTSKEVSRAYGGTGLGLNIAHRIVKSLGGEIEVRSRPGRGTSFEFEVEVKEGLEHHSTLAFMEDRTRRLDTIQNTFDARNKRISVLYLDDNDFNLMVTQEIFGAKGNRVWTFSDPFKALEHLNQSAVDVVLTDLNMPEMSGAEFADEVRQLLGDKCPPILGLTASDLNEVSDEVRSHFDSVYTKPMSVQAVMQFLEQKAQTLCV